MEVTSDEPVLLWKAFGHAASLCHLYIITPVKYGVPKWQKYDYSLVLSNHDKLNNNLFTNNYVIWVRFLNYQ